MEARFCECCGALTESPQVVNGRYYCSRCAAELTAGRAASAARTDSSPSPSSAPLRDSAAPVEEKLKFRCTGCGALLSSKKVPQKSRLRCPQCHTELFLHPDGSVEPVVKVKQPSTPTAERGASHPQTGFSREELEHALDMQKGPREEAEQTDRIAGASVAPPPPPPPHKPTTDETAAPSKPVPKMRVARPANIEKYRKMVATLESEESEGLVAFVAVLLLLPTVFVLLVFLDVGGLGRVKDSFKDLARSVREAVFRLRGLTPKPEHPLSHPPEKQGAQQKQPQKQPGKEESKFGENQLKQPPEEKKPPVKPPEKAPEKR